jgi:hypothetical protein
VNESPRALRELGDELDRVARRVLAAKAPGRLVGAPPRVRRLSAAAILVWTLLLAAAAAAAVLLIRQGSSLSGPHAADLRASGIPVPGSARLAGLDAPDPTASQPPWDLRLSRTRGGETCTAVGQVLHGRFGIVGLDGVFRRLPLGSVDVCGIDARNGPILAGARELVGATPAQARTIVSGVAGRDARTVTAYGRDGRSRHLTLGPDGSFITVYAGQAEAVRPRIEVVARDGSVHDLAFEQSSAFEVPDPQGGSPWAVSASADVDEGAFPDEDCVQATRQPSEQEPSQVSLSLTPSVCGRLAAHPVIATMRRFVPGEYATPFPWGNAPSRTMVYGIAAPRVVSLALEGAGAPRRLAIDPHGGAFLAVLDGRVDPRALTLTASLHGGGKLVLRHSTALYEERTNKPLAERPVPAWRAPARPGVEGELPPFELPIPASVRETLRALDPAGGPTWALRTWRGNPNPEVRGVGREPFMCAELGVVGPSGSLLEPSADRSLPSRPLSEQGLGRCNTAKDLRRLRYMVSLDSFLDDPYDYAPQPARTVVSGMLPPGASAAVLSGMGPSRALTLDANDGFLIVLPGRYWGAFPRISYVLHGRRVGRRVNATPSLPAMSGYGPRVPQVRAPDPDGGAPWGFTARRNCATAIGRIVDGRLATIDAENGDLLGGALATGWSARCLTHPGPAGLEAPHDEAVEFDLQPLESPVRPPGQPAQPLDRPQIERRTLPGRTVITGVARANVVSVTISTPSDVRTLRPSGPLHELIAVYDGFFPRGEILATIRLRGGRVVTQTIQGARGEYKPPPLSEMLSNAKRLLVRERATLKRPGGRHVHRHLDASLMRELREHIEAIERRLAFERAHPGLLPRE